MLNDSMRIGKTGTAPAAKTKSEKGKTTDINLFRSLNFCHFNSERPDKKLYAIFKTEVKLIISLVNMLIITSSP